MYKNILKLFLILNFSFFIFNLYPGCKKDLTPVNNDQPEIKLIVEEVGVTETWLRLNIQNPGPKNQITITRNDSVIRVLNASTLQPINSSTELDTLIYDSGLLPNHDYTYAAKLTTDSRMLIAESQITTIDTTSHNFTWDTLSIGVGTANELRDVAIINDNDIWAVGEIHTEDTDRFDSLGNWIPPYNAVHWDGNEWELKRIYTQTSLGSNALVPLTSIFAFDVDDVWVFSEAGGYGHWDGPAWDTQYISQRVGGIDKIWGSSSSDIYFIGTNGNITYYNGQTWQNLESGTDTRLRDVWGSPDSEVVWACGWEDFKPTVLLKIEDGTVIKVYEDSENLHTIRNDILSGALIGGLKLSENRNYILSHSGLYSTRIQNNLIYVRRLSFTSTYFPGFPFGIDGNGENDVFIAGERFMIAHFNGYSWRYFDSLYQPGRRLYSVAQKGNMVVAVGRTFDFFNKAVILTGNR